MNPLEIKERLENLEVVFFLGAKFFSNFRGALYLLGGHLALSGLQVIARI